MPLGVSPATPCVTLSPFPPPVPHTCRGRRTAAAAAGMAMHRGALLMFERHAAEHNEMFLLAGHVARPHAPHATPRPSARPPPRLQLRLRQSAVRIAWRQPHGAVDVWCEAQCRHGVRKNIN